MSRLQGVSSYNRDHLSSLIEVNLVDFFNWGCVQAGGFVEVPVPSPGLASPYGQENLKTVHKEGVVDGKVWQAENPAWCYEQGLDDVNPTVAQGVYVNGVYYPSSTTGQYAHYLDFVRGLVIFNNPLLQSSKVQIAHSYRRANFVRAGMPWFQSVVLDGYYTNQNVQGGVLGVLDAERLQTPFVIVEVVSVDGMSGYELGGSTRWVQPDVMFYVLASNKDDRDRLSNVVTAQYNNRIVMYDLNARRQAGDFNLDARGSVIASASSYPQLLDRYYYNSMCFKTVSSYVQETHTQLYMGICRVRLELVVGDV